MASACKPVACYHPIRAYKAPGGGVAFSPRAGWVDRELWLPCGQCIGCKLERSRQWAVRCMHEAQLHAESCFVTLTYSKVPPGGSLDRAAFPSFIRRLRKILKGRRIKYFHCGEYGEHLARPHYHGLIFGYSFPDATKWRTSSAGHEQYRSAQLEQLWPYGFSSLGPVTFETAAYTARYCTKKITGDQAAAHYRGLVPEFMTCSKGIGQRWLNLYGAETYRDDSVVVRGVEAKPPRYYDKAVKEQDPQLWRRVELARIRAASSRQQKWNRTPERLAVREEVKASEMSTHRRGLDAA